MVAFPVSLDALTNPTPGNSLGDTSVLHSTQHATVNDAIEAIEAKVGVDNSTDASSLDYWIKTKTAWVTAAKLEAALPRGVLPGGYAQVTASQGSITTDVDLTGLTVTVTVGTSRRVRITASGLLQSTVADDSAEIVIKEGVNQLQVLPATMRPANVNVGVERSVPLTPTAGIHTYKLTARRVSGTGTITFGAAATIPAYILVEDIGAA